MRNGLRFGASLSGLLVAGLIYTALLSVGVAQSRVDISPRREPFGFSLKRFKSGAGKQIGNGAVQQKTEGEIEKLEDTIRVETSLAVFDILVTDATHSHVITGLSKDDFLVREDAHPQQVSTFTLGNDAARLPRSVVLIIDWSGSQQPYFEASIEAAKRLIEQLAPTDQMAIVTDDVQLAVDFTSDKKRLKATLDSLHKLTKKGWKGKSLQFSALLATLRELIDVEKRRPIIIFQTDGDEAEKLRDAARPRSASSAEYHMSDIYTAVERSRVRIYTVIPSDRLIGIPDSELMARGRQMFEKSSHEWRKNNKVSDLSGGQLTTPDEIISLFTEHRARDQAAAAHVAELSGGWTAFLEQPEQAAEVYGRILSDINQRYIIGYYPTNKERDGRLREVEIEVRGHPEYIVHGRHSYYATPN